MTTLRDLSRHLGLSVTQVSRALNGHSDVNEETRNRVLQAANDLKYQPNISARRLATGRSGMVGLVLPGPPDSPGDSYFVQMIAGFSTYFSRRERQFILHIADPEDNAVDVYRRLIDSGALDGFILLSPAINDPRVAFLRSRGVPFVTHGRIEGQPDYPFFDIDNDAVGYRLARHLTDLGHRRIAFINGPAGLTFAEWRREGYLRALTESGAEPDPALHVFGPMTEGFGLVQSLRLLTGAGRPPTAFICGNTMIAKGVYQTIAALGLRIPEDISVVAHDDELPGVRSATFDPAMTVLHAPLLHSWSHLPELLLGRIDGLPLAALQRWDDVIDITRASTAPPPAAG